MRRWGIGSGSIAALGVALLVLALGGCGGSGSGASTSASGGQSAGIETTEAKGSRGASTEGSTKGESGGQGSGASAGPNPRVQTAPLKVSGGGSTQYRVKGGDNSIQEYGGESDETELEEAARAMHDYLVARAEEDWPAACARLAKSAKEQLQALASRSEGLKGKGCAAILEALTPPLPPSVRRESTIVDAGSLRAEGERAFLIYRGAEGATYAVSMSPEDGWKVGSLAAIPIS